MTPRPPTPGGRGQERPHDAEPLFPSEGTFSPVVPLSEVGHAPAPLPTVRPADVGKPAEAAWARAAHRAKFKEDEETLVPSRAARKRGARPSVFFTASVVALSVIAGLASGTYLLWSSQRAHETQPPAPVAAEATPAPVTDTKVEQVSEPVEVEKPREVAKAERPVAKAEKVEKVEKAEPSTPTPKQPQPTRAAAQPRDAAEPKRLAPAPKPSRTQSNPPARARLTTAETRTPARTPPISSPPPSAKSKKVIQWP
ncbi:MAG: hypothetical protein JOZ96_14300 [Acidobacteria bacterium]|nr:hypothetical protein [Acidobacteriota bacterium]